MDSHMDNCRSSFFFVHKSATKKKRKKEKNKTEKMNEVKDKNLPI